MYLLWCIKCRNQICMLRYNIQNCIFLLSNKVCKTQDLMFFAPHNKVVFFNSKSLQAILERNNQLGTTVLFAFQYKLLLFPTANTKLQYRYSLL